MKPLLIFRFLIHLRLHCACIEKTNTCLGYGLERSAAEFFSEFQNAAHLFGR